MPHAFFAASRVRRRSRAVAAATVVMVASAMAACAPPPAEPAAAVMRETSPPWAAPRDAISYIQVAGLEELTSGYAVADSWVADLVVTVDGDAVEVPPYVGMDRVRAIEAPLHTHDNSGTVWAEHPQELPALTLGEFFDLWGVRFTDDCLGDACGTVAVTIDDGAPRTTGLREIAWTPNSRVTVDAKH